MLRLPSSHNKLLLGLLLGCFAASATGCQILAGLGGEEPLGGGGATSTTGGTGGTTGGTGGTTGGTGGLTGTCTPAQTVDCYSGPPGTVDKGLCKGGQATCKDDGTWGICKGEIVPSVELCSADADEDCDGLDCLAWVKTFEDVDGQSVVVDAQGNIFAAITFNAGVDFGDGNPVVPVGANDLALLEYDKSGTLIAKRVFAASGIQHIADLAIVKDGTLVLAGQSDEQIDFGFGKLDAGPFVAKLDATMTPIWARAAVANNAQVEQLAVDSKGNVFVGGYGTGINWGTGMLTGPDSTNFWVAKLGSDSGTPAWTRLTMGQGNQYLRAMAVDPSDSLVLAGANTAQYLGLSDGSAIPSDVYNCCGNYAPFLLRVDTDGATSNGKTLADTSSATITALANDKLGVSTVVGMFSDTVEFQSGTYTAPNSQNLFILRDQTGGFTQTSTAFEQGGVWVTPEGMAMDSEGSVAIYGNYAGAFDPGGGVLSVDDSMFVAKFDKDGAYRWVRTYNLGDGNLRDIATGPLDETVLIGKYLGSADLGTGLITGSGMFLLKLGK